MIRSWISILLLAFLISCSSGNVTSTKPTGMDPNDFDKYHDNPTGKITLSNVSKIGQAFFDTTFAIGNGVQVSGTDLRNKNSFSASLKTSLGKDTFPSCITIDDNGSEITDYACLSKYFNSDCLGSGFTVESPQNTEYAFYSTMYGIGYKCDSYNEDIDGWVTQSKISEILSCEDLNYTFNNSIKLEFYGCSKGNLDSFFIVDDLVYVPLSMNIDNDNLTVTMMVLDQYGQRNISCSYSQDNLWQVSNCTF